MTSEPLKAWPEGQMRPATSSYNVGFVDAIQPVSAIYPSKLMLIHDQAVAITPLVSKVQPRAKCGPQRHKMWPSIGPIIHIVMRPKILFGKNCEPDFVIQLGYAIFNYLFLSLKEFLPI